MLLVPARPPFVNGAVGLRRGAVARKDKKMTCWAVLSAPHPNHEGNLGSRRRVPRGLASGLGSGLLGLAGHAGAEPSFRPRTVDLCRHAGVVLTACGQCVVPPARELPPSNCSNPLGLQCITELPGSQQPDSSYHIDYQVNIKTLE